MPTLMGRSTDGCPGLSVSNVYRIRADNVPLYGKQIDFGIEFVCRNCQGQEILLILFLIAER